MGRIQKRREKWEGIEERGQIGSDRREGTGIDRME